MGGVCVGGVVHAEEVGQSVPIPVDVFKEVVDDSVACISDLLDKDQVVPPDNLISREETNRSLRGRPHSSCRISRISSDKST